MSLINNALKRARAETATRPLPAPNNSYFARRSFQYEHKNIIIGMIALALCCSVGLLFIINGLKSSSHPSITLRQKEKNPSVTPIRSSFANNKQAVRKEKGNDSEDEDLEDAFSSRSKLNTMPQSTLGLDSEEEDEILLALSSNSKDTSRPVRRDAAIENAAPLESAFSFFSASLANNTQDASPQEDLMGVVEEISHFLNDASITSVAVDGPNSKVRMNNQLFQLNTVVYGKHGVKITAINDREIIFTDNTGTQYRKPIVPTLAQGN